MKKGLITLAVILALVMSIAVMAPAFAAEANDFDCVIVSPKAKDVGVGWGGQGTSIDILFTLSGAKDYIKPADDGSAHIEGKGDAGEYIYLYPIRLNESYNGVTSETYPYVCASVKVTGINDKEMFYIVFGEGTASDMPIDGDLTEYTKIIGELPSDGGINYEIIAGDVIQDHISRNIMKVVDYANGGSLNGVDIYIEYIGFFKTEADAQAFDYAAWVADNKDLIKEEYGGTPWDELNPDSSEPEASEPEASEPEESEPEASEPEASEPEASEPEASEPESSESQTSKPQTSTPDKTDDEKGGSGALIYILIAAAVVIVVVVAVVVKKAKK